MKKNLLKIVSLLLIFTLALPFGVSAYTVEELEDLCEGKVTDSGEGYYILNGALWENEYIDENANIYGKYLIMTYTQFDIENVSDCFLGVKISRVISYIHNAEHGIFVYDVELYDRFGGTEAELIWASEPNIKTFVRHTAILDKISDGIAGDVNGDEIVDAFDCLIVKGIYFETYDATEDELLRADINGDGEIDMFDYLEVKAIYFEQ